MYRCVNIGTVDMLMYRDKDKGEYNTYTEVYQSVFVSCRASVSVADDKLVRFDLTHQHIALVKTRIVQQVMQLEYSSPVRR